MTEISTAPSSTTLDSTAVVEAPPLAASGVPLCFVVDEEASIRHFLSLVLHGVGIDTMEFPDGKALREAIGRRTPNLVFHNISLDAADAIETMIALGKSSFRGSVQLMSSRGAAVLEHVKGVGTQHKLSMLPVLKKPFETDVIVKVVRDLNLGEPPAIATRIGLEEALANNWIEFWYQPKIDIRKKQLAGAEAYARARHPEHGIVLPSAFMPDASDSSLLALSERAVTSALKAGQSFGKLGINLPLTVNIPFKALLELPIEDLIRANHPDAEKWPGLIVDVPEDQVLADLTLATELSQRLEQHNVRIAVDDFGRGHAALSRLSELPFVELKLDRAFVIDCGVNRVNAPLCKTVIDLAHNFGRAAVAMGIEKAPDALALVSMGCDYGQGFLLGQPMPEERFVSLLRQRAATQGRSLPA